MKVFNEEGREQEVSVELPRKVMKERWGGRWKLLYVVRGREGDVGRVVVKREAVAKT